MLERAQHPDADRLGVCQVDVGEDEAIQIVCGAPNVGGGQFVPVARVGAVMPGGMKIKKAKLRGVASNGMICSAKELELGLESDGILVLATVDGDPAGLQNGSAAAPCSRSTACPPPRSSPVPRSRACCPRRPGDRARGHPEPAR